MRDARQAIGRQLVPPRLERELTVGVALNLPV